MTITAIQPQPGNVMLVAERNGLREGNQFIGGIRRPVNGINDPPKTEKA
jgi:hypothetical protein